MIACACIRHAYRTKMVEGLASLGTTASVAVSAAAAAELAALLPMGALVDVRLTAEDAYR